jgi:hypothetical protein
MRGWLAGEKDWTGEGITRCRLVATPVSRLQVRCGGVGVAELVGLGILLADDHQVPSQSRWIQPVSSSEQEKATTANCWKPYKVSIGAEDGYTPDGERDEGVTFAGSCGVILCSTWL